MGVKGKFAIVASARSGSNHLSTLLASHPQIFTHGEIFHPSQVQGTLLDNASVERLRVQTGRSLEEFRAADPIGFLDFMIQNIPDRSIVGFKIFTNHNRDVLRSIFADPAWKIILLERPNRLATYSSERIGVQTGIWHSVHGNRATASIAFDADLFERQRMFLDQEFATVREMLPASALSITYDALNTPSLHQRLVDHVGADPQFALKTILTKQNPARVIDRFSNPDDVLRHLDRIGHPEWAVGG